MSNNPNDFVQDKFREKDFGLASMPSNSKPATSNFYVDRSRLGFHDEYDPTVKNEWGGRGKYVPVQNRIVDNARDSQMTLRAGSSFKDINAPKEPTNSECSVPCGAYGYGGRRRSKQVRGGE